MHIQDIHVIPISTRQFVYDVGQLRLRGDVIIRCYQLLDQDHQEKRELMSSCQFHTCAVTDKTVSFSRSELDYAYDGILLHVLEWILYNLFVIFVDERFPSDHRVTLHFDKNPTVDANRSFIFQSPLIKIEEASDVTRFNSLESIDDGKFSLTQI